MNFEKSDLSNKEAIVEIIVNSSIKDTAKKETSEQTGDFFKKLVELAEDYTIKSDNKIIFRVSDGATVTHTDKSLLNK